MQELKRNLLLIYSFCIKNLYSTFTFCKTVLSTLIKHSLKMKRSHLPSWTFCLCLTDQCLRPLRGAQPHVIGCLCPHRAPFLTGQLRRWAGSSASFLPLLFTVPQLRLFPSPSNPITKARARWASGTKPCTEGTQRQFDFQWSLCCRRTLAP